MGKRTRGDSSDDGEDLLLLTCMGYRRKEARQALQDASGDFDGALRVLEASKSAEVGADELSCPPRSTASAASSSCSPSASSRSASKRPRAAEDETATSNATGLVENEVLDYDGLRLWPGGDGKLYLFAQAVVDAATQSVEDHEEAASASDRLPDTQACERMKTLLREYLPIAGHTKKDGSFSIKAISDFDMELYRGKRLLRSNTFGNRGRVDGRNVEIQKSGNLWVCDVGSQLNQSALQSDLKAVDFQSLLAATSATNKQRDDAIFWLPVKESALDKTMERSPEDVGSMSAKNHRATEDAVLDDGANSVLSFLDDSDDDGDEAQSDSGLKGPLRSGKRKSDHSNFENLRKAADCLIEFATEWWAEHGTERADEASSAVSSPVGKNATTSMSSAVTTQLIRPVQAMLARYPGNGARYVRHRDNETVDGPRRKMNYRCLTAILYLSDTCDQTPWKAENGGQLRAYLENTPADPRTVLSTTSEKESGSTETTASVSTGVKAEGNPPKNSTSITSIDVDPVFGRIVLFAADIVPHEVLPSFRERTALTMWFMCPMPNRRTT
ncbi:unnamed protein product [Amoebophrya sp. A25]|nr:unnamed protein product [Amoebophrya sp. A25]|eukprot:GSA25T00023677001.1